MIAIRRFNESDWPCVWAFLREAFAAGDACVFAPDSKEADIHHAWVASPAATYVAVDDGRVVGSYYLRANQPGLGSHVCNCAYVVTPDARGQGLATLMCEHSQLEAVAMGFRAMQFNLVVMTDERALRLWQRLGFSVVGTLPRAFHHRHFGYVDACVMYKELVTQTD
ncbi:MAG TPA: GNAT family N-acetyltransferase [Oxalicibacterium sp.]|nr:GNAT family N-acetyltransferase [Oxalicibacterium sp.]